MTTVQRPARHVADEEGSQPMPAGRLNASEESREEALARIGDAVREARLTLGISSQAALAERAGVVTNPVVFLERGQKMPWMANRRKIESALNWPVGSLTAMLHEGAPAPTQRLQPVPTTTPQPEEPTPPASGELSGWVLNAALRVTEMAATIADIAARYSANAPEAQAVLAELSSQTNALEQVLSAGLVDALTGAESDEVVDQLYAVMTQIRRSRKTFRSLTPQSDAQ
ncbi:helix-turn-helix transcriptional regulator [Mycobacterium sp. MAC_011194_8550]|uniref:helix-turn-helix domain-containing protein n=1 Tax=Mycobacterium sp. MAC_011194_8550 TaxID=1335321 RepID=UPI0012DE9002|nr:helix-turn-helix transcriptional regulator [Mycobacterium sp. MAC_011194_8550]